MDYEKYLYENIEALITKMKNMVYRPGTAREVLIPKQGKLEAIKPLYKKCSKAYRSRYFWNALMDSDQ
jgi:hypothetical protein